MSGKKSRSGRPNPRPAPAEDLSPATGETRAADAVTIAWVVTVATVLMCNLGAAGGYGYAVWRHPAPKMFWLADVLVLAATAVTLGALPLTVVMYRVRRTAPPPGLVVFALCCCAAPLAALGLRVLR